MSNCEWKVIDEQIEMLEDKIRLYKRIKENDPKVLDEVIAKLYLNMDSIGLERKIRTKYCFYEIQKSFEREFEGVAYRLNELGIENTTSTRRKKDFKGDDVRHILTESKNESEVIFEAQEKLNDNIELLAERKEDQIWYNKHNFDEEFHVPIVMFKYDCADPNRPNPNKPKKQRSKS